MRILHLCLSCFYIDGRAYQENELIRCHVNQGNEVLVVASTETYDRSGEITYIQPSEYIGHEGARVIRLGYIPFLPHSIARKFRAYVRLKDVISDFRPDVILFHGACAWALLNVASYVASTPGVSFYIDSHEDYNNSARNFVSREILHRWFYGPILRFSVKNVKKILCVSTETINFVVEMYKISPAVIEFFPLGGYPISEQDYKLLRDNKRAALGISDHQILVVQTGRFTNRKRLIESLIAVSSLSRVDVVFIVAGVLDRSIADEAERYFKKPNVNIKYIGWLDPIELRGLLCAADIYLQPGTQSATMQDSLCCRCAVILDNTPAHLNYMCGNGWLINHSSEIAKILQDVDLQSIDSMKSNSYNFAVDNLDYVRLSSRVLL
jgi:1,2-diacylglycerol 3-alpha-glucosyltransferase